MALQPPERVLLTVLFTVAAAGVLFGGGVVALAMWWMS